MSLRCTSLISARVLKNLKICGGIYVRFVVLNHRPVLDWEMRTPFSLDAVVVSRRSLPFFDLAPSCSHGLKLPISQRSPQPFYGAKPESP